MVNESINEYIRYEIRPSDREFFTSQLQRLVDNKPDHPVSILARHSLTSDENRIATIVGTPTWQLFIAGALSYASALIDPRIHLALKEIFEPFQHFSNAAASFGIIGISVFASEGVGFFAERSGHNKLAKGARFILPVIGAATVACYQFLSESGYFPFMGTPDKMDAIYGIAAVSPSYITLRAYTDIYRKEDFGFGVWGKFRNKLTDLSKKISPKQVSIEGTKTII
ncbi:hypothetical protein HY030_01385 [Candidatus Gottesmanbacteria bacterium]|nr:hypothetical protein [Candidatus Gottesmanbacteria bacterium]